MFFQHLFASLGDWKTNLIELRHYRILGLACPEFPLTVLLALFLSRGQNVNCFVGWFAKLMLFAIAIHFLFDVHTQLNWWLGLSQCPPNFNSLTGIFPCPSLKVQ